MLRLETAMTPLFLLVLSSCHPTNVQPPKIACAASITVGLTTVNGHDRRYGKGLVMTGGHSGGARCWYDATYGVEVRADGFNYSSSGEVIDGMEVEWTDRASSQAPIIHTPKVHGGLLNLLHKGMSPSAVAKALRLPTANEAIRQSGLIRYSSKLGNKDNDRFTTWNLNLHFQANQLTGFGIEAD